MIYRVFVATAAVVAALFFVHLAAQSTTVSKNLAITITPAGNAGAYLSAVNLEVPTLNSGVNTIPNGGSATLTWDSASAGSCTGSGFTIPGSSPGIGSVTVSPTATKPYSVNCGGATASVTVTVSGTRRDATTFCAANGGGDGTSGNPWRSACINAAVAASANGDTIFLAAGNWTLSTAEAPVVVTKNLNFVGAGSGNTFDAMGHPNNPGVQNLSAAPGGTITAVRSSGANVVDNCTTGGYMWLEGSNNVSHIYFDGTTGSTGLSACALPTYEANTGPGVMDDVRALQMADSSYGPSSEGRISMDKAQSITVKNSIINTPIDIRNPSRCMNAAFQMSAVNGFTLSNSYLYHLTLNSIFVENLVMTGSVMFMQDDVCSDGVLPSPAAGPEGTGIGPGATSQFDSGEGSYHFTMNNNLFLSAGEYFGLGPGVNDPTTNGGVSDQNFAGNWIIASYISLDSCANHLYNPSAPWTGNTFDPHYASCAPRDPNGGGMQVNAVWQPWLNCSTPSTSDPPNRDNVSAGYGENFINSLIATAGSSVTGGSVSSAAQLVATGTGIVPCTLSGGGTTPHTGTAVNFRAHQNYLSSSANRYVTDADTINPSVTGNFCTGGGGAFTQTDSSPCASTGFTTPPTVSFTLGTLFNTTVPFTATNFTAQYGAVKWLASTSSATPTSGDGRWNYLPPFSLSPVAHGNTVYMWTMDSANHISSPASAVVP